MEHTCDNCRRKLSDVMNDYNGYINRHGEQQQYEAITGAARGCRQCCGKAFKQLSLEILLSENTDMPMVASSSRNHWNNTPRNHRNNTDRMTTECPMRTGMRTRSSTRNRTEAMVTSASTSRRGSPTEPIMVTSSSSTMVTGGPTSSNWTREQDIVILQALQQFIVSNNRQPTEKERRNIFGPLLPREKMKMKGKKLRSRINYLKTKCDDLHHMNLLRYEDPVMYQSMLTVLPPQGNEPKIYCPSRDNPEAELTISDIKCLDPGEYLSSPVINYYIQYIKKTKFPSEDCREKFYIYNTYFYGKLEEALGRTADFSKLRRWWKGVNILNRSYIMLPIHGAAHWSLVIICIPAKESISGPIILHLDSLGIHGSTQIFNTVERYLEEEWHHLKQNPSPDTLISETIWKDLPSNVHKEKVQVPQQSNQYDCGLFMLYYIERFIREAPERLTRDKLDMFNRSWFKPEDASGLRLGIRKLLLEEFDTEDNVKGRESGANKGWRIGSECTF